MIYIKEIFADGKIGDSTPCYKIAQAMGWTIAKNDNQIEQAYNGAYYLKDFAPQAPSPTYQELRIEEYPEIKEQLDMIYWDKINNTNLWQETITNIKNKYPKT